jgi:quercetin dioxygenase-like cupin family protein
MIALVSKPGASLTAQPVGDTDGTFTQRSHGERTRRDLYRRRMGCPITRGLPPTQLNVAANRLARARTAWHSHDGGQTLYITEGAPR